MKRGPSKGSNKASGSKGGRSRPSLKKTAHKQGAKTAYQTQKNK